MIRINLAKRRQPSYASDASAAISGMGGGFSRLKSFFAGSSSSYSGPTGNTALALRIGLPLLFSAATYFGYDYYVSTQKEQMQVEVDKKDKEKSKIQEELKRIKGFELVKAELERNELILRTKIETIEKLIKGRDFTVKSLVTLSQSIPPQIWLTEMQATEAGYVFKGSSTELSLVSDLMSRLGSTVYFKDITLKNTVADANGKQANFELTARRE